MVPAPLLLRFRGAGRKGAALARSMEKLMRTAAIRTLSTAVALLVLASVALAQFDPQNGQWGKDDPTHVRVMTFNVFDHLCSTNAKVEQRNSWTALARIVAALKPDVLILQETADNEGNGTGSHVDTVEDLETTMELFFHGGDDPFLGGEVTAYVQKYDPDYDLPFFFGSSETDGFNRNLIASRFPFEDLNGDGKAELSDIDFVFGDLYAPGGDGGIRGFQFAELDLPDDVYCGDLVVGNAHLKAGFGGSDHQQRVDAARNVAYWIDHLLNGAGTGIPDPRDKIRDNPEVSEILREDTAVVKGGDFNEDEDQNGTKGPAEWLVNAQLTGSTDGTDRDRSDSTFDDARDVFTNERETLGNSKLDYLAWQDSIASLRVSFVFDSLNVPEAALPPELVGFLSGGRQVSIFASDHRPVIVDLALPLSEVTAILAPESTVVPRGGNLVFDASVTSQIAEPFSGQAWINVYDPDGTPFGASNPKFGPKDVNLQPGQTKQKSNVRLRIPGSKPPGTGYRMEVVIGTFPDDVCFASEISFEVTD